MGFNISKLAILGVGCMATLSSAVFLQSCDDDADQQSVDLRYRVEDVYQLPCKGAAEELSIKFQVKSTDSWEVFGENKKDWYVISPANGEAGQTYDVVIKCKENTSLDDRVETIHIKSNYWTGKKFTLAQKGTAYLNYEEPAMMERLGEKNTLSLKVLTNQKWSAKIIEGADWLNIEGASSGELDGQVVLTAGPNYRAMRYAKLALYDRNNVKQQEVGIIQDGVKLQPVKPENQRWYEIDAEAGKFTLHVDANTRWFVEKASPEDETWYEFEKTEFNGEGDVVITFGTNGQNTSVRNGTIVLTSVSEMEGVEPVVETIRIKQASTEEVRTTVHEVNRLVSGNVYMGNKLMPGRYSFYIAPFEKDIEILFIHNTREDFGDAEYRFRVTGGKTELSTKPYNVVVSPDYGKGKLPVNMKVGNVLTMDITVEKVDGIDYIGIAYYLNNQKISSAIFEPKTSGDRKVLAADLLNNGGHLLFRPFGPNGGSFTVNKYVYIEPLKWGE